MTPARFDDRGLATERTTLAWSRAAVALVAAGALLVRLGFEAGVPEITLAIGAVDVLLAARVWLGVDLYRRRRERLLRMMAGATAVTAAAAVVLAFFA